ncbi:EexN family lipoprotein [Aggregatibacter actinomycetemcomitans]|uniref:EexN family lipoprotein n=1 Tax=Aggregatibacter actinomycetemcomitans TaxID=714 RepID=UPI00022AE1F7|nr:EexN family lipoprotein [Aggregatibacter actinomycetemcomitans]KOE65274.1 hypothetical protein A160_0205530 [Aggregatibacter actinomycetemcomitans serotype e str. A160]KOE67707.1 hypothetical protein SCC393_0303660 [Aggregatibacter actinomycetemcomitans serotype e str. SCC393]KOE70847.1 hypothetical protein D18P1_0300710 [Aggregatibacter actinomycetemcomitans serotype f str. D18P1]KYK80563.1 hypothetical protein SA2876_00070 [Aggregatibacter actinomycetemcomitans serotype e str. SA2876]KYK8
MKKLSVSLLLAGSLLTLAGCEEKNLTVYDYLQNEKLLMDTLNQCRSRSLTDETKCETVKRAYSYLDLFQKGTLSDSTLKKLGKK